MSTRQDDTGTAIKSTATAPSPRLSKSKIIAGRQCERRIWLEVHRPDLREFSDSQAARLEQGTAFGELARTLLGPGELVECGFDIPAAVSRTKALLESSKPPRHIFEAALSHQNVVVRVDALRRVGKAYELIEVKSSTRVKDYYLDDCAVQTWVSQGAGITPRRTQLALVDRNFVYHEEGNYNGLLHLEDVTSEIADRLAEVPRWVRRFRKVLKDGEPDIGMGSQCTSPYDCPFIAHCQQFEEPDPEFPLTLLPNGGTLVQRLADAGYSDLREVPDNLVSRDQHLHMLQATRSGMPIINPALRGVLASLPYPRRYLDFEAIQFIVPRWLGTSPFEQIPFQWSCHIEKVSGDVEARSFLDVSGEDPRRGFAESMVKACGKRGPILVYNRSFEAACLSALARQFPDLSDGLTAIRDRLIDLLPMMRKYYYHPDMRGSWSLKSVLPAIAPDLSYEDLGEVADGQAAQGAYLEAISPATESARRKALKVAMLRYCERDTLGLVEIVRTLST